jgi:cell wall assembly regulator SMI1
MLSIDVNAEACVRLENIASQTLARLLAAYGRHARLPEPHSWPANIAAGKPKIDEAERLLGVPLPLDLAVSYEIVTDGAVPLCGWYWWPLDEVVLQTRLLRALASLRQDTPQSDAPVSTELHTADGIKLTAWHSGWIPVAESTAPQNGPVYLLCIDTAPKDERHWGQLIEIRDPSYHPVDPQNDPPRRVASSWLSYWQRLAVALEMHPMRDAVSAWVDNPAELRLRIDGIHPLPGTEPDLPAIRPVAASPTPEPDVQFELSTLSPARKKRASKFMAWPRQLRETRIRTGGEPVATVERCFGDAKEVGRWLKSFGACKHSAFGLWIGCHGDGLTTLVMQEVDRLAAAHRRDEQKPVPFYLDLAPLVDHGMGRAPATLAEAIRLELKRRGLPDGTRAVLQAISDGRCALFLDHAESVALYQPAVWRWPSRLPRASTGLPHSHAHVLMLCADEYFDEDADLAAAVDALRRSVTSRQDEVWLATLDPLHDETSREWCAEAGFDLANRHAHNAAWQWLGFGKATAGRIAALRPLFEPLDAAPPEPLDLFATWWQHSMPGSVELDTEHLQQIAVSLALMQLQADGSSIPTKQYAALVQHCWPETTPARQALLRMSVRIAMQLQRDGSGLSLHNKHLWGGLLVVAAVEAGDLSRLGMAVVPGWQGTAVADAAVETWRGRGLTAFPEALLPSLQAQHAPEVTGALFRLACQFARKLAAELAHARLTADRAQDFKSRYVSSLRELLAPLSQARLVGASLKGAFLRDLPLTDIDLSGADLTAADFANAHLLRVSLDDARADDACFDRAVLHDVSAERLVAHRSQWRHARWNRHWPTAQLTAAVSTVAGVHPGTSDGPPLFAAQPGEVPGPLYQLLRSPDGRWLAAVAEDGGVGVWHGDTLAPAWHLSVATDAGFKVLTLAFSHDSTRLITSHAHKSLKSWSLNDGQLLHEYNELFWAVELLLVHPDGKHVVGYGGGNGYAWCNADLQRVNAMPITVPAGSVQSLACAAIRLPGGESVFAHHARQGSGLCEYTSIGMRRELNWPVKQPWRIAMAHDAGAGHHWLAVLASDEIWLGDPDAPTPALRFEHPGAVAQKRKPEMAFSPDGRWLVCVGPGGPAIAIATRDGSLHRLDAEISRDARCAAFDQAGRLILGDAALRVCPLPDDRARVPDGASAA